LWDKKIATGYGYNYTQRPAEQYLCFMSKMKEMAKTLKPTIDGEPTTKTLLKLIDEFNYARFTKSWV
jgi:hypothetical protein